MRRPALPPIRPMEPEHAAEIAAWRYCGEYSVYNWPEAESPQRLLDGGYVLFNQKEELIGFYQFGGEARTPVSEENAYPGGWLDIGLGLRPNLCGLGLGRGFVLAGLDFARSRFSAGKFRLTVAAFNLRAQKACENCGFRPTGEVRHKATGAPFRIMTCRADLISREIHRDLRSYTDRTL